jgi:hypothetical protein
MTYASRLNNRLWEPVDNRPLIVFRILLGFLLFLECMNDMISGKVAELFIKPAFTFPFIGFEWLQPLPGNGMYIYFSIMGLLGIMIMTGVFYRIAMAVFTVMWTIIYLMQKCDYNNHYYLIILVCLLMCFMPAHRRFAVDVYMGFVKKSNVCPGWVGWLFIIQFGIVYTFAAINKINAEWLSGRYMKYLMTGMNYPFLQERSVQLFLCYSGLLFDLLITPLLLYKRTRISAFCMACVFHLFNAFVFNIGIFPFLALSAMIFFFPETRVQRPVVNSKSKVGMYVMGVYLLIQLLLPVRYLLYSTDPNWTEEGFRMSWRMMLRNKAGWVYFRITDPDSGKTWTDEPENRLNYITLNSLVGLPDMIWQYAQRLKEECNKKGFPHVRIYVMSQVSLNGGKPQFLIDPNTDLADVKWEPYRHAKWIVPLQ